jgi:hypothetical protein
MSISQLATLSSVPIAVICLFISIRAFYIYNLSRSDMIFVLGMAMAVISTGTAFGLVGELHLGGNTLSTDWARSCGAYCGGMFIFLSSLVQSHEQMRQLKRWQIIATIFFVIVVLFTPLYPPIRSPLLSFTLNGIRMLIYSFAFVRYTLLYLSKSTRFSLIMSISFLVLIIGYALNIPGIFQAQLAAFTILAATIRISAYISLLVAYSLR